MFGCLAVNKKEKQCFILKQTKFPRSLTAVFKTPYFKKLLRVVKKSSDQVRLLPALLPVILFKLVSLAEHGVDVQAPVHWTEVDLLTKKMAN
jgi:hypothetical protein